MKNKNEMNDRQISFDNHLPQRKSIKSLNEDDRPREKLLLNGKRSLSDSELLAIILGSGNREQSAVELAQQILKSVNHQWDSLAKLSVAQLCKFKGIGEAKAISIITCLEIGNRRMAETPEEKPKLNSAEKVYASLQKNLRDLSHEEFWVIFLDYANQEITRMQIGKGGFTSTTVDIRIIMKLALEYSATAIIMAHNHPSGNLMASEADISLTENINEAAKLLNIKLLDHIIFTNNHFFSFANEGLI